MQPLLHNCALLILKKKGALLGHEPTRLCVAAQVYRGVNNGNAWDAFMYQG